MSSIDNNSLVSVIVPIYNVEKYLLKCLESIAAQSYKNIEVILVNDGSTDCSGQIAQNFCDKDTRFSLINQINGGLSNARNTGLAKANGDYIVFIDSDDWANIDFIKLLVNSIETENSDFVCCRLSYVAEDGRSEKIYGKGYTADILIGEDIILDSLLVKNIHTPVWAKLYNLNFLREHQLTFKDGIINEDTLFTSLVSLYAKRVSFVNTCLFYSLERKGSISRSKDLRLFSDMDIALAEVRKHMLRNNSSSKIKETLYARYVKSFLYNLLQSAQRQSLNDFINISSNVKKNSKYIEYGVFTKKLSKIHRIAYKMSIYPVLFWVSFRLLNFMGIKMH